MNALSVQPCRIVRIARCVAALTVTATLAGCVLSAPPAQTALPDIEDRPVGNVNTPDAISAAAFVALANGEREWTEDVSGAIGTVRGSGQPDALGCLAAELTIHDFTGLRIEERRLCPPGLGL